MHNCDAAMLFPIEYCVSMLNIHSKFIDSLLSLNWSDFNSNCYPVTRYLHAEQIWDDFYYVGISFIVSLLRFNGNYLANLILSNGDMCVLIGYSASLLIMRFITSFYVLLHFINPLCAEL